MVTMSSDVFWLLTVLATLFGAAIGILLAERRRVDLSGVYRELDQLSTKVDKLHDRLTAADGC